MKDLKKRTFVWTLSIAAVLFLGLTPVAAAQDGRTCSQASWRGEFGYTFTGTLFLPTGPVPFAGVGRETTDAEGNVSGFQNASVGGSIKENATKGIITAGPNCTATGAVSIFDPSGTLLRTATWYFVLDDNTREFRAILTSLLFPNGPSVPATVTMKGRKQFPGHQD